MEVTMKTFFVFLVLILPLLANAQYKSVTKKTDIGTDGKTTSQGTGKSNQDEAIQEVPKHHVQKQEFQKGPYKSVNEKWEYNYIQDEEKSDSGQ